MSWIVGMLVLVLLAASCDGSRGPAASPSPETTPAEETPTPDGGEPTPSDTPDEDGGPVFESDASVLDVAVGDPSTLDPMRISDPGSFLIARQLFDGLTRWDQSSGRVLPAAARSWSITDGGRTFTFRLRDDLKFHDGAAVTAQDFEFAFDRIARKASASDLAYTLQRVEGFAQVNRLGSRKTLHGVRSESKRTLVIRLSQPFYDFPAVLTHPGLVPVPEMAEKRIDRFLRNPIGNGPFRIARDWAPGEVVTLEAFDDHYDPPELDGIQFIPYEDPARAWLDFDDGKVGIAEVPVGQFEYAAETYGNDLFVPFLSGYYYGFNLSAKSFRDIRVRRAVNYAVDREAIIDEVYKGAMSPPRGVIPEGGLPGFEGNVCGRICTFDPGGASAIVGRLPKKARSISLDFTKGRPHDQVARMMASDLRDAGFKVRVSSFGFAAYLARLIRGQQGMYRFGWLAEYPSADAFLTPLFDSGSADNYSSFSSPTVDKLLDRAHSEPKLARRTRLYRAAEKAIMRRVPIVPIGTFNSIWAARANVNGVVFDVLGGFDAVHVSLSD